MFLHAGYTPIVTDYSLCIFVDGLGKGFQYGVNAIEPIINSIKAVIDLFTKFSEFFQKYLESLIHMPQSIAFGQIK